jgi:hypothetical protein
MARLGTDGQGPLAGEPADALQGWVSGSGVEQVILCRSREEAHNTAAAADNNLAVRFVTRADLGTLSVKEEHDWRTGAQGLTTISVPDASGSWWLYPFRITLPKVRRCRARSLSSHS